MSGYIWTEASLAAHGFFLGLFLMILYDGLRLLRLLVRHKELAVGLEDFFYWLASAFLTFSMLLRENDGILRGYVIGCVFCGMYLYDRIVSRNVFDLLKNGKRWIKIKEKQRIIRREERKYGSKPK